jgi:hypothetical protein
MGEKRKKITALPDDSVDTLHIAILSEAQCPDANGDLRPGQVDSRWKSQRLHKSGCRSRFGPLSCPPGFLGLAASSGRIVNLMGRQSTGVEHFANASGPLPRVSLDAVLARYDGGREAAEKAPLAVFEITNKGIAHATKDMRDNV